MNAFLLLLFLIVFIQFAYGQQIDSDNEDDDDDDCAFISGQHCDSNGICKYCAMCLQSSCILSKTIGNTSIQQQPPTCNATQFGTTNLYNWYDYCLSSDNDSTGDYCATSTECYQYRKSVGPSVSYAWHNLTCNPSTCMLMANNGAPPPIPVPPSQTNLPFDNRTDISNTAKDNNSNSNNNNRSFYHHPFHNPAAIALTIVCSLVLLVAIIWLFRFCRKRETMTVAKSSNHRKRLPTSTTTQSITSTIPSSAPPSFSSTPPDMAIIRHPHLHLYQHQQQRNNSIHSGRSSTGSSVEPLPSYLSPYTLPPKYEQAIVTQIRGLRSGDSSSSSSSSSNGYHSSNTAPLPSMWVPVYFTQQQANFRRGVNEGELFGFTPNHSYWLQQISPNENTNNNNLPPHS